MGSANKKIRENSINEICEFIADHSSSDDLELVILAGDFNI